MTQSRSPLDRLLTPVAFQMAARKWAAAEFPLESRDGTRLPRNIESFRFGPAVAAVANQVLAHLPTPLRLTGHTVASTVGPVPDPSVILTRTNATAVRAVLEGLREGRRPFLVGGGTEIVSFAKAARDLMAGIPVEHPELACFESWGEVQEYVERDEQGGDLRLLVDLIDEFGVDTILRALDGMADEASADLVVSTAHKSKGREWDSVRLAGDFGDEPDVDELRLLYVAATRAKLRLDLSAVKWFELNPAGIPSPAAPEPVRTEQDAPQDFLLPLPAQALEVLAAIELMDAPVALVREALMFLTGRREDGGLVPVNVPAALDALAEAQSMLAPLPAAGRRAS